MIETNTPPAASAPPLRVRIKRHVEYATALAWQTEYAARLHQDETAPEALWLVEHTPVITAGRTLNQADGLKVSRAHLRERGIDYHAIRRGGELTWHGPGQWTIYPVLRLTRWGKNLHSYLRKLEEVAIRYLATHELVGKRVEGKTGVWIGGNKLVAVGVGVHRWISLHGLAINIQPDLSAFTDLIVPCGIAPSEGGVTSLAKITERRHDMEDEAKAIIQAFVEVFPYTKI